MTSLRTRFGPASVPPATSGSPTRTVAAPRPVAVTAALIALAVVSVFVWHGRVIAPDATLTADIVQRPGSVLFRVGEVLSLPGSGAAVLVVSLVIAAVVWHRSRDLVLAAVVPLAGAVGGVGELVAKQVVERLRPPTAVFTGESGYGFPSGHTTGFVAMVVAAVVVLGATRARRLGLGQSGAWVRAAVAAFLAIGVGLGRVFVGAHYVGDIVGGVLLGTVCASSVLLGLPLVRRIAAPVVTLLSERTAAP